MNEVLTEAIAAYNLPLTVLVGLIVAYWLLVIVGVVGMESFDFDVDADLDANTGAGGGIGLAVLRFLNFGLVPAIVVLSVLVLSLWTISLVANFALNPAGSILIAIGLFCGNLFISAFLTKLLTAPLKKLFVALDVDGDTHDPIVGRTCVVKSLAVTQTDGQAEVDRDGATFLINVRISEGQDSLVKGDRALVVAEDKESSLFNIRKDSLVEEEQTNNHTESIS